jgi:flavin reductase (DIM6/NTAB) family NADH-FMN oxidoreductase RutF
MKEKLNGANAFYPVPMFLVGSVVGGKPTFMAAAHMGIHNASTPWQVSVALAKERYTSRGIREHGVFSVNMVSEGQAVLTDYAGLVSGADKDKGALFKVWYGELDKAPLIEESAINMECRVTQVLENASHEVFMAEVVQTYAEDAVLEGGAISLEKFKPLLFDISSKGYYGLGRRVGDCWSIGKQMLE